MTDLSHLAQLVEQLPNAKVLCIGDVMLDRFVYGSVTRISPEAPIPIIRVERESAMLGGAGNVARNATALGASVRFLSLVGDDLPGREVMEYVANDKGVEPYIQIERNRPTTIKTRYIAGGQQLLRSDNETTATLAAPTISNLSALAAQLAPDVSAIILSDYGKGVLHGDVVAATIAAARKAVKPVIVDPKGTDYSIYRGATVVTPNRAEAQAATGIDIQSDEDAIAAATKIITECGIENVLLTRSQDGMTLVTSKGEATHLPTEAREVFDVSGAGDTVVACLASAIAGGASLSDAARIANVAAGIVVGKIGTAVVYPDELISVLHHHDLMIGEAKLMPLDRMVDRVERWRRKGYKVGFTNGCFDLLHPGHLSLLQQARSNCDRLIVGLNSDASVKRLKGEARPVQSEAARAAVLGSLETVSGVVIFGEDTPITVIEALKPDILVKGADYTIDKVVGADIVQGYGGKVVLANLADGFSTTSTIARINQGKD
ncbi:MULTISPECIES: D-glycero-beta-D-manno-heptose-7-phosphate kinase [Thalassospira]|jgi:D-beta-D-heptose 7-phosphate kinase/D-beta-D-heptose 1-phosphate adenosyltransferase|uniref:Bifunctional protein HldE n=1 Tax=Thalassospira xiamenensis TaxID=220697 RepID=A0ABR5XYU9_9PROT|nr:MULTISPECIES: D-glycero-beta-D-manno-heptose-7-phosphate kinase [Thalassospira]KZD01602.1 bifunctional heptose 7-phosphate kinase/heptose 1-phosphate adenyltransferase [Thalassospira xiamenensis]KZD11085.1 bifunctional heptose 7-phosphate kinase/heptose 1-phosphate adenyltransferase [Thalassospira xiamenensis]MAB32744.1 bifunctional heptose 7-phosphate kinase/heptose 1-phosphate adenyltransferase [Thalassospira sp.]MAL28271.1 bifunctional heptose 7-phosphate kinase/heptose 1-phosphate adenyl|tara:strand:+ start:45367 stop:46839 length:1473 start_codon:yes stop_codon:yes gene_type:complete